MSEEREVRLVSRRNYDRHRRTTITREQRELLLQQRRADYDYVALETNYAGQSSSSSDQTSSSNISNIKNNMVDFPQCNYHDMVAKMTEFHAHMD